MQTGISVSTLPGSLGQIRGTAILRILLVAFNFPPDAEVGAKRAVGLCRYLPEFGVEPVVLTSEPSFYEARDFSVPDLPGVTVVRAPMLFMTPLDWYRLGKYHLLQPVLPTKPGSEEQSAPAVNPQRSAKAGPVRKFFRRNLVPSLARRMNIGPGIFRRCVRPGAFCARNELMR